MRSMLVVLACLCAAPTLFAQDVFWAPGTTTDQLGGLVLIRQGNQTTWSLGGILFSRRVKQVTRTPEGPVVTRFILPSALQSPNNVPIPGLAPASLQIEMPDPFGIVYIDGELLPSRGTSRVLESQPLAPGKTYPLKLRAAYAVGDRLLIEEKTLVLRAGETQRIAFDGRAALAVALPHKQSGLGATVTNVVK